MEVYNPTELLYEEIDEEKRKVRLLICNSNDEILVAHYNGIYMLPGGSLEENEILDKAIKKALRREIMEELGKEIEINGYVTTIENLFEMKNSKYYEILFVHNIEFKDEEDKKILETMQNKEGKEYLRYEWVDIDELDKYDLRPKAMKRILKEKQYTPYIINDDFKV